MKKLTIILFFLTSFYGFTQNINEVSNSDSIYFYFSENQFQKKDIIVTKSVSKDTMSNYSYYLNGSLYLKLSYKKYKSIDDYFDKVQSKKEYHRKSFLNKNLIINIDFLKNVGLNSSEFRELLKNKKLFIIDEQEFTKRKILIREVFLNTIDVASDDTFPSLIKTQNINPFYFEMQMGDTFYTFLNPETKKGEKDLYILFEPSFKADKYVYEYVTQLGENKYSEAKIQEQYTLKLKVKKSIVFFQLTNKRKKSSKLPVVHDLFEKDDEIISIDELCNFSEAQLEKLFSNSKDIYIVEGIDQKNLATPKLVSITTELNDFIRSNNDR